VKPWLIIVSVLAVASLGVLAVTIPRIVDADPASVPAAGAPGVEAAVTPELLAAMQRDLGLNEDQARERLRVEAWASQTAAALRTELGEDRFAGAWLTDDAGQLMIAVTDDEAAALVEAAGAEPTMVSYSESYLLAAQDALNRLAEDLDSYVEGASDAIAGWHIELSANTVVVHAPEWAETLARRLADATGQWREAIQVVISDERPRLLSDVRGGDEYHIEGVARCSVGFSVVGGFVTAGHCALDGVNTSGVDGTPLGEFVAASFPGVGADGAEDWGVVEVYDGWTPQPEVNDYQGGTLPVAGSQEAPVGSSVCKYGATTGVSCGLIVATDASIIYPEGTITGLTRTTVCAEPGDSGGAWLSGDQAQGVTSGGSGDCTVGGSTYFQPLNEVLRQNDLTLVTTGGGADVEATTPPEQQEPPAAVDGCDAYDYTFQSQLAAPYFVEAQPDGRYYRILAPATHTVCLAGPDGADFDMVLQQWDGEAWETVAWSAGPTSDELITFDTGAGYYRIVVVSLGDSGGYVLGVSLATA
jgi:streptogrisin C